MIVVLFGPFWTVTFAAISVKVGYLNWFSLSLVKSPNELLEDSCDSFVDVLVDDQATTIREHEN